MTIKTGMLCMKCKDVINSEDDIFGTSCGHLYHFLCLRECHSESQKCSHCETYKPCIFKMFLEFGNVIPSWEEQTKTIKLHSELEKCKNDVVFLQEKYRASQVLVQQLEGKLKKLNDALNSKNVAISDLEDRAEKLQVLNNFLNKEKELLTKNFRCESEIKKIEETNSSHSKTQTNNKKISNETTKENTNINNKLSKRMRCIPGNNEFNNEKNASNSKEINVSGKNDLFSREISNSTENLKENQKNAQNKIVQNSQKAQENAGEFNKIVVICNYNVEYLDKFTPEECVIYVARKMKIKLSIEDINKVIVIKNNLRNCSLLVYFKDILFQKKFLLYKNRLKKFSQTNCLEIKE